MIRVLVPADKSISHRAVIISSLEKCQVAIENFLYSDDTLATLSCMRSVGVKAEKTKSSLLLSSPGLTGLTNPNKELNANNSGTTARLLIGLFSGLDNIEVRIDGDTSLRSRPMERVASPLNNLGKQILLEKNNALPARVIGNSAFNSHDIFLKTASAQIKSAIILAAYASDSQVKIELPLGARNHTENMLYAMGANIKVSNNLGREIIEFDGRKKISPPKAITIPADPSSAAIVLFASIFLKRDIQLESVLDNETRDGFFRVLESSGFLINKTTKKELKSIGEWCSNINFKGSELEFSNFKPIKLRPEHVSSTVDEIPLLIVISAFLDGVSEFEGISELRVKESDRLDAVCRLFNQLNIDFRSTKDSIRVIGSSANLERLNNHTELCFDARGDHRIVMLVYVLSKSFNLVWLQEEPDATSVSFPNFFEILETLT